MPDGGATFLLPRLVGLGRALELMLTGELVDADEALRIGLANRVVEDADLEKAAGTMAEAIAAQPPIAVRGTKRAIDRSARQTLGEGLREAAVGQAECIRSGDFVEAIAAVTERRAPRYENR